MDYVYTFRYLALGIPAFLGMLVICFNCFKDSETVDVLDIIAVAFFCICANILWPLLYFFAGMFIFLNCAERLQNFLTKDVTKYLKTKRFKNPFYKKIK